jgi:predicted nucleotidyltransferase
MRYENFEGPVKELVIMKIREIEEKEHIRVLHAVESGSRAWGFASPDSDYDVRFIYVRDKEFYLSLRDNKDFIDWELNEVLDINGWDLKKALQHFHKSNATLFEWSNSPVVYYTTEEWKQLYQKAACKYFSCKSALYHYYGTANKNYYGYLTEEMVKYKKYFYVLRPILACRWIEEKKCPPPVLFDELFNTVLEDDMKAAVEDLLSKKVKMSEADKAPRIEKINQYIEEKLAYYKALADTMDDDRNPEWEPLEKEFIKLVCSPLFSRDHYSVRTRKVMK